MTISKADLARELNVTTAAVNVWLKRGLRADARGCFDRTRSLEWIAQNIEPQVSASGVSRGSSRAAELLGRSRRGNHSNGGNGHDAAELANPALMRARRDRAMAEKLELQNAVSRGQLVHIDDVVVEVAGVLATVRARFLGLPSKLAPSLATANTPEATHRLLYDAIVEVLTALSSGDAEDETA